MMQVEKESLKLEMLAVVLMLAQNLIRKDKAEAQFRLGISEESADLIAALSPVQISKIASG
jgi:flagellar transcriptional activator FlhD